MSTGERWCNGKRILCDKTPEQGVPVDEAVIEVTYQNDGVTVREQIAAATFVQSRVMGITKALRVRGDALEVAENTRYFCEGDVLLKMGRSKREAQPVKADIDTYEVELEHSLSVYGVVVLYFKRSY